MAQSKNKKQAINCERKKAMMNSTTESTRRVDGKETNDDGKKKWERFWAKARDMSRKKGLRLEEIKGREKVTKEYEERLFMPLWTGTVSDLSLATRAGEWILCGKGKLFSTPILQVLNIRKLRNKNGRYLWRLILSDGEFWMQGIFSPSSSAHGDMDDFAFYTVVRLDAYSLHALVHNPVPVVLVHSMTVLSSSIRSKLGSPTGMDLERLKFLKDSNTGRRVGDGLQYE